MPSNIEIKAKAHNLAKQTQLAEDLSDVPAQCLFQEDIFFPSPRGRLKLRILSENQGELISYHRNDQTGPKQSRYHIYPTQAPFQLKDTLSDSLGIMGIVKKRRTFYLSGQTRIHLDEVEQLGEFIELEVVMEDHQTPEEGHRIVEDLMKTLEIQSEHLIDCAYIDLLMNP